MNATYRFVGVLESKRRRDRLPNSQEKAVEAKRKWENQGMVLQNNSGKRVAMNNELFK